MFYEHFNLFVLLIFNLRCDYSELMHTAEKADHTQGPSTSYHRDHGKFDAKFVTVRKKDYGCIKQDV